MIKNYVLLNRIYLVSKCRALSLAAATQYFWFAESNIGLLPLACPLFARSSILS